MVRKNPNDTEWTLKKDGWYYDLCPECQVSLDRFIGVYGSPERLTSESEETNND